MGSPAWLTGGRFGPEGGLLGTLALTVAVVLARHLGPKGADMNRAAVIGAGTMGNGIAHVFAQHGWSVALIDTVPAALEKATATIRTNLDRQVKKGALAPEAPAEVLGRITTASALDAAADAALVVEAASENPGGQVRGLRAARPHLPARPRSWPPTPARSRSPRSRRGPGGPGR